MTTETAVTPKVCIQCLASYNAGRLVFEWVDATEGIEALQEAQEKVKVRAIEEAKAEGEWPVYFTEPEEFMLADWEGFGGLIGEWTPLSKVAELAEMIEEHGEALLAYVSALGSADYELDSLAEQFQERHRGEWESMRAFAENYVDEGCLGEIPEHLMSYIDIDAVERDLEMDHFISDGHVFSSY